MSFSCYLKQHQAGRYPPVPPGTGGQLPGDSRNFIPNRFDIPASKSILQRLNYKPVRISLYAIPIPNFVVLFLAGIIDKKPGSSVGTCHLFLKP